MSEFTIEEMMEMGLSLDQILSSKDPMKVDVSVNTDNLVSAVADAQKVSTSTIKEMHKAINQSNQFNKDLLVKALSMVIKQVNQPVNDKQKPEKMITGLKIIRNKNSNLLENIKILRE